MRVRPAGAGIAPPAAGETREVAVSEGFAAELAARRGASPDAVLDAASAAEDEAVFLARLG